MLKKKRVPDAEFPHDWYTLSDREGELMKLPAIITSSHRRAEQLKAAWLRDNAPSDDVGIRCFWGPRPEPTHYHTLYTIKRTKSAYLIPHFIVRVFKTAGAANVAAVAQSEANQVLWRVCSLRVLDREDEVDKYNAMQDFRVELAGMALPPSGSGGPGSAASSSSAAAGAGDVAGGEDNTGMSAAAVGVAGMGTLEQRERQ